MHMHRARIIATVPVLALAVALAHIALPRTASAAGSDAVEYRPPSDAAIIDHFRPPEHRWGAGNRGIDYGTAPGSSVRAAADGRVVFAGEVGGALHVTLEHADRLRTTSSFLASTPLQRGDRIRRGDLVGTTAGPFHFGVRTPSGAYLDPELVLAGLAAARVLLVPGADDGVDPLGTSERRSLLEVLSGSGAALVDHLARTGGDAVTLIAHGVRTVATAAVVARVLSATARWVQQRGRCTPASMDAPRAPQRRIAIEVSGLGTSSESNSAWEFDTERVGYAPADVIMFSYRGGRVPDGDQDQGQERRGVGIGGGAGAPSGTGAGITRFSSTDSQQPVGLSADRLAELIEHTAAANPGTPIDLLAHSQGGVVARLAIGRAAQRGRLPDSVATLVTVGSPHAGAPLATGADAMRRSPTGRLVLAELRATGVAGALDDRLPAAGDLAATSDLMRELRSRDLPDQVRFVSLGGSGDLIVPGVATIDPMADDQRILPTSIGTAAHGALTSDARTTREISLAVAGLPLTCQTFTEAAGAFLAAEMVSLVESTTTLGAAAVAAVTPVVPSTMDPPPEPGGPPTSTR